jgi:hypothetical protein
MVDDRRVKKAFNRLIGKSLWYWRRSLIGDTAGVKAFGDQRPPLNGKRVYRMRVISTHGGAKLHC